MGLQPEITSYLVVQSRGRRAENYLTGREFIAGAGQATPAMRNPISLNQNGISSSSNLISTSWAPLDASEEELPPPAYESDGAESFE